MVERWWRDNSGNGGGSDERDRQRGTWRAGGWTESPVGRKDFPVGGS